MLLWQHLQDARMEAAEFKAAFQETQVGGQAVVLCMLAGCCCCGCTCSSDAWFTMLALRSAGCHNTQPGVHLALASAS